MDIPDMGQPTAKRARLLAGAVLALLVCSGCRRLGFYDPVYSEAQVKQLLQRHQAELSELASEWTGQYQHLDIQYSPRDKGSLLIDSRATPASWQYPGCSATVQLKASARNSISPARACGLSGVEASYLLRLCRDLKIASINSLPADPSGKQRYVEIAFQGGGHGPREWPYGLIYIPPSEPANLLNSANGGPGPGFSKLHEIGGRWFYFESEGH
jgi:hypothetical protein